MRGLSEGICVLEKMGTWIAKDVMPDSGALLYSPVFFTLDSLKLYGNLFQNTFILHAAANMPAQRTEDTNRLASSTTSDHLMTGAPPGCGAFFESATMPNPMATSMPQPAMSYHTSLTPPFVAVLPPDPPPPPSVMVCSRHQAHVSVRAEDLAQGGVRARKRALEGCGASPILDADMAQQRKHKRILAAEPGCAFQQIESLRPGYPRVMMRTSPCAASCRCSSLCSSGAFFVISTALRYTSFDGSCSNNVVHGIRSQQPRAAQP